MLRRINTEEKMRELMRLNFKECYFDKELLEEFPFGGTTIIPFTQDISLDILQSHESDHSLTVTVRKEWNLTKFKNRHVPN